MNEGKTLNVVENSLRDLIELVLRKAHGDGWFEHLKVPETRVQEWRRRHEEEPKRRPGGEVEKRLLYYADFYDLETIIKRNWDSGFSDCFGDRPRLLVYLDRLSAFRNPGAHSRSLLPFEEHLVLGMSGALRQEIAMFLSRGGGGPEPEHFPRIEEVRDSYGMRVVGSAIAVPGQTVHSKVTLRPGDSLSFTARAWDPAGGRLKWRIYRAVRHDFIFVDGNEVEWEWHIEEVDIGQTSYVSFDLYSERAYHRSARGNDDSATLYYSVLPLVHP